MTTIITPGNNSNGDGSGTIMTVVVILVLVVLFFVFALPAIRNSGGGNQVNVPDTIDVNVNGGGQQ